MSRKLLPRLVILVAASALLSACGGASTAPVRSAGTQAPPKVSPAQPPRQPGRYRPRGIAAQSLPGLEGVIGATADGLVRQFGPARLDVWEGDARKLQFTGTACVLDIFLYPGSEGGEAQAAYVDARRASDGLDVDRAACISALRIRR